MGWRDNAEPIEEAVVPAAPKASWRDLAEPVEAPTPPPAPEASFLDKVGGKAQVLKKVLGLDLPEDPGVMDYARVASNMAGPGLLTHTFGAPAHAVENYLVRPALTKGTDLQQRALAAMGQSPAVDLLYRSAVEPAMTPGVLDVGGEGGPARQAKGAEELSTALGSDKNAARALALANVLPATLASLAVPAAGPDVRSLGKALVPTSDAARALEQAGVTNMTVGQSAAKGSLLGGIIAKGEQVGAEAGGVLQPFLREATSAPRRLWQEVVHRTARAPITPSAKVQALSGAEAENLSALNKTKFGAAKEDFHNAYSAVLKDTQAPSEALDALTADIQGLSESTPVAMDSTRAFTAAKLKDRLSLLPEAPEATALEQSWNALGDKIPTPAVEATLREPVSLDTLQKVRSGVQQDYRAALAKNDTDAAGIFRKAADRITQELHAHLTPKESEALRLVDSQYRNHRILGQTLKASKSSPEGFTPAQVDMAVRSATKSGYETGAGGPLLPLVENARVALEPTARMTGINAPKAYIQPGLATMTNLPVVRDLVLGRTGLQGALRKAPDILPMSRAAYILKQEEGD